MKRELSSVSRSSNEVVVAEKLDSVLALKTALGEAVTMVGEGGGEDSGLGKLG